MIAKLSVSKPPIDRQSVNFEDLTPTTYTSNKRCIHIPPYGHPIKWPSTVDIADTLLGSECICICLCTFKTPEMWKPLYSVKQLYRSPSSNCSIILALLLIVLAFLNMLQQWRGPNVQYLLLHSLRTHYHSFQKYTGSL